MPLSNIWCYLSIFFTVLFTVRFSLGLHRDLNTGLAFAVFLKHGNRYLDVPNHRLSRSLAVDDSDCFMACLLNPQCYSYNLATAVNLNDLKSCELLSTNISNNPTKLRKVLQFDYWSIEDNAAEMAPNKPIAQNQTLILCEDQGSHNITCGSGTVIRVLWANYGQTVDGRGGQTCPGAESMRECTAGASLGIVRQLCEGKTTCSLYASNSVFGDPCEGTEKYLEVHFTCG